MATDHELRLRERLTRLRNLNLLGGAKLSGELEKLQRQLERIQSAPTDEEIWRSVELARHQDRPYTLDYVERLFEDWVELHGDRGRADDAALVIGIGRFADRTVALVGNQKGRDLKERTKRNFGMAQLLHSKRFLGHVHADEEIAGLELSEQGMFAYPPSLITEAYPWDVGDIELLPTAGSA